MQKSATKEHDISEQGSVVQARITRRSQSSSFGSKAIQQREAMPSSNATGRGGVHVDQLRAFSRRTGKRGTSTRRFRKHHQPRCRLALQSWAARRLH